MTNCEYCLKSYTHGGNCYEHKQNCIFYEQDIRGKLVISNIAAPIQRNSETTLLKAGVQVKLHDTYDNHEINAEKTKIRYVDLDKMLIGMEIRYFSSQEIHNVKKKSFKLIIKK
jgi:glutamate 5-kinase